MADAEQSHQPPAWTFIPFIGSLIGSVLGGTTVGALAGRAAGNEIYRLFDREGGPESYENWMAGLGAVAGLVFTIIMIRAIVADPKNRIE